MKTKTAIVAHSSTPWTYVKGYILDPAGYPVPMRENAEYIVKAVNAHEKLIHLAERIARTPCVSELVRRKCICSSCMAKEAIAATEVPNARIS